ncbi:hypothetical protein Tco_0858662 [Tanacetum coccineum]|uniref:Uncharacterized protein n=1 Tax=Tanacetum coccineum TaxID=301880 RepID=A0ABQ5B9W6_9ASTR
MFMTKIAKRLDENSNLIKEIRASMDFALRNQEALIKTLEIQVGKMSIILHKKLSGNLQSLIEIKPRVNDGMISTSVETDMPSIRRIDASQYAVSNLPNINLFSESKKTNLPSPSCLNDDYWDELKETDGVKDLEAYYTNAKPIGKALPQKEKRPTELMDNALRKNRSHDPKFEDYIGLNYLNKPIELSHYGALGEKLIKGAHFGAKTKSSRKSTDLISNTSY